MSEMMLWMLSDMLTTLMILYPMRSMECDRFNRKELFLSVVLCVVLRPVLTVFVIQKDVQNIAGLSVGISLVGHVLYVILITLYMYRNQNTGLYCSLTCVLIAEMIRISCEVISQYVHVKLFYDNVPAGTTYLNQLALYTCLFCTALFLISGILKECRKPEDNVFGNVSLMCLANVFLLDVIRNAFEFVDSRTYFTMDGLSYMRITSDQIIKDIGVLALVIMIPVMTVMMIRHMVEVFYSRQKEEGVLAMAQMNRDQLSLIHDLQEYHLHEKHEIAQHLNVIEMFMEKGEYDSARMYIQKTAGIMDEPVAIFSRNPYLNAVICYKVKSNPDIAFHVESMIGEVKGIEPVDLGILLMNLIDCRIDEIRKYDLAKKISIILKHRETTVTMYIHSEVSESFLQKHPLESGIVENTVGKYHGMLEHDLHRKGDTVVMLTVRESV